MRGWTAGLLVALFGCDSLQSAAGDATSVSAAHSLSSSTSLRTRGHGQSENVSRPSATPLPTPTSSRRPARAPAFAASPSVDLDPERMLVATSRWTPILSQPAPGAQQIGYLRNGQRVARHPEPVTFEGCSGGFFAVEPHGYVCVGARASIDPEHVLVAATARPDVEAILPYRYALSAYPTPPFYTRIPTLEEQRSVEPDLDAHLAESSTAAWAHWPLDPIPEFLREGLSSLHVNGRRKNSRVLFTQRAVVKSGYALMSLFEAGGRQFGLTTDYDILPLDRLKPVRASHFQGVVLDEARQLPVAFVRSDTAYLYAEDSESGELVVVRRIGYREAFPLSGNRAERDGQSYLQTTSGLWLKETARVTRIERFARPPRWATPGRTWIDVSLLKQSLVAYEGEHPVYATLVSTGAGGVADPGESRATVQGQFLIHTKYLSAGMSSNAENAVFDLREVPYVQYFSGDYALHAAYWHDAFGVPLSQGCINLSPRDARWLFEWTEPPLPQNWSGVTSAAEGTLVHIHP